MTRPLERPLVIQARKLTQLYRNHIVVNGINFDIRQGNCFGFLGPNGAGNTITKKPSRFNLKPAEGKQRAGKPWNCSNQ